MPKRKLTTVVVASAATGAVLTAGVIIIAVRRHRKKRKKSFLSKRKRKAITEVIKLSADEVMPDGIVASMLLQHHLDKVSDKELLLIYGVAKAGEYMREEGINPLQATAEQIAYVKQRFDRAQSDAAGDREALVKALLAYGFEELKPMLADTLFVLEHDREN